MATRFRFRLQPLLRLRKSLEEAAQRDLARALQARMDCEATLTELKESLEQTHLGRAVGTGDVIDLEGWRAAERYLVVLERRILQAESDLLLAENRVVEAREALMRAHQAHLTLARLKERRQAEHELAALQEAYQAADDIAVLRHRFNTRG